MAATAPPEGEPTYSVAARRFHWWTVALVALQIPIGLYMNYRGNILDIWDGLTNWLYSAHKSLGLVILALVLARLVYRLIAGAPPPEPTIEPWQRIAAAINHWSMYALLLILPVLGWLGISLYGALDVFGLFSLPALAAQNQETATLVLNTHKILALLLIPLIGIHIAAALFHYLIRRDGVMRRMIVRAGKVR
jgi:cytochrome b561